MFQVKKLPKTKQNEKQKKIEKGGQKFCIEWTTKTVHVFVCELNLFIIEHQQNVNQKNKNKKYSLVEYRLSMRDIQQQMLVNSRIMKELTRKQKINKTILQIIIIFGINLIEFQIHYTKNAKKKFFLMNFSREKKKKLISQKTKREEN